MKLNACSGMALGLVFLWALFGGWTGALAARASAEQTLSQSATAEESPRVQQQVGEPSVSYENGLLTVKARGVLPQLLFKQIADKIGVEIEVDQSITDLITVEFSKIGVQDGLDKIFDQLGNGSYAVEYVKDGDSKESSLHVDRVFILRRSASDGGEKGSVRKVVTGKKVLSKEEVLLIANNRILKEAIYRNSNGDPSLVTGLKIGEPYLRWGIRFSDRHLFPTGWGIPMFNEDNRFVSEQAIEPYSGRNTMGLPPSSELAYHYYTLPKNLIPIQTEAVVKYNMKVSGDDLAQAVRVSFWDAKMYWLFPRPTLPALVAQFRSAVNNVAELVLAAVAKEPILAAVAPSGV